MKRLSFFAGLDADDKSIWKRLKRNVSISALGSAVFVAIRLAQTVLLTRYLEIDDYGRVLIVLNLFVFLNSFFGLRVSDLIYRFFPTLKHEGDERGLRYLLLFCLGSCLASGLLIYGVVLIISPWLAGHLYSHSSLSTLFNIYGCTLLVSAFSGVYEPILRIYDRFSAVVVPQILGSALTLIALLIYFGRKPSGYDLRVVVTALAIGLLLQVIPPFLKALRLVQPLLLFPVKASSTTSKQTRYRREFFRCLFNSNLSGYLKFAIDPGDIFLLGVFSSPTQVALYGLAQRLVAPLTFLQTTIQTAVVPEITTLVAKLQLEQLQRFVARYVKSAFAVGGILLLGTLVLGRLLLLHFFSANYAVALPVFYCLVIASWLLLVLLVFRPLAVSLDLLKWHNLALFVSALLVAGLIIAGKLNALTMASVQLAEAAILRLAFSVLVWKRLRERKPAAVLFPG